jgi:hypothetical protein
VSRISLLEDALAIAQEWRVQESMEAAILGTDDPPDDLLGRFIEGQAFALRRIALLEIAADVAGRRAQS